MGSCIYCGATVFLREEETRCDRCKNIITYYCNSCKQPFDVQDKKTKKKELECKWCGYFLCPKCNACSPSCTKFEHHDKIRELLKDIIPIDKWNELNNKCTQIVAYFEDVKMRRAKTTCEFGVPKTYAKEKIKGILARMDGFKVRDIEDQQAFEERQKELLDKEEGYEFTIGNSRTNGSYGQEYRDVFNLGVCLGKLKYKKKSFLNKKGIEVSYDSWIRTEENPCQHFDKKELIVKYCPNPNCQKVYDRNEQYCHECTYLKGGKIHEKGSHFELKERLSNNPTCKIISQFKKRGENGESESEENN